MWSITEHGFISLVEDKDDAEVLQVRGRDAADIRAHFPDARVYTADGADYRYRARVGREKVAQRLADLVRGISYQSHFKDTAVLSSPANPARLRALYGCWHSLAELQDYRPYSTVPRGEESTLHWDDEEAW